jgi:hypothetical protein
MEIKTKFNIGDKVALKQEVFHFISCPTSTISEYNIFAIYIIEKKVQYHLNDPSNYAEDWYFEDEEKIMLFENVNELLNDLHAIKNKY